MLDIRIRMHTVPCVTFDPVHSPIITKIWESAFCMRAMVLRKCIAIAAEEKKYQNVTIRVPRALSLTQSM